jgi:hypothetical protein
MWLYIIALTWVDICSSPIHSAHDSSDNFIETTFIPLTSSSCQNDFASMSQLSFARTHISIPWRVMPMRMFDLKPCEYFSGCHNDIERVSGCGYKLVSHEDIIQCRFAVAPYLNRPLVYVAELTEYCDCHQYGVDMCKLHACHVVFKNF